MTTIYAQFSDSNLTKIITVFGGPQDPEIYPNQATIDSTDARYQAFVNPPQNQALAALAAGAAVTCTSNSAINGTYSTSGNTKTDLLGTLAYIAQKGTFFGGASTMIWHDQAGAAHTFNVTQFTEFAEAIGAYIFAVEEWVLGGASGSLPSNSISIA